MELKNRSEMDAQFCWDLTPIFESDEAWESAYADLMNELPRLSELPGTLSTSAQALKNGLDTLYDIMQKLERIYEYAFLRKSGDNGDTRSQEMEAKSISALVRFQTESAFLNPEVIAMDPETLKSYMADESLATYRHMADDVCRARAYTLDVEREKMLALLGDAAQTPSNVFEMFESVDMTFPNVIGENGEALPLSHGSFSVYREHRDRAICKDAFEKYFGACASFIHTLTATYAGSVKLDCYQAQVRGYESACQMALHQDNVSVSLYDNLVASVAQGLPTMKRYLELRREMLGLDELHIYDLYTPIVESVEYEMPYERACALVKDALMPLGAHYAELLDEAFTKGWIDVYENKGKTTGAFSSGVFGVHPYVLLNYAGKLDDAFTLAHELGHAMHSWHSDHARDFVNHDYSIFVAEVASTVNEVLLSMYLLKTETDPQRRAYILNHFLEGFRTTVFRQTQFAEFERIAHEMAERGEPLTAEALNQVYRSLNAKYYEGVQLDDYTDTEWARIPHFYRAFYVYQYATGFCSAVTIADRILNHNGAEDYLRFLSTGGSDYPIEELKIAGVDLNSTEAILCAMRVFSEMEAELEQLLRKAGD
ncbi:MAG: oligoendopeptidase F [Clostridia bacterium]|nr:oligoendopeptidase F [Clostridia bacterium]